MAKDVTVARQPEDVRAQIEAQRGIVRDENGKRILTHEWRKERIAYLTDRIADFDVRKTNAKAEIAAHQKALKSK